MKRPEYDPNEVRKFNVTAQWELTFSNWEYHATFIKNVGGNCGGFYNLESAITQIWEELPESEDEFKTPYLLMHDASGNEHYVEDELSQGEEWLKEKLTEARFLGFVGQDDG